MGVNIKLPKAHAIARELTTCGTEQAKRERLLNLLEQIRQLPWHDRRINQELHDGLFDDDGLPF